MNHSWPKTTSFFFLSCIFLSYCVFTFTCTLKRNFGFPYFQYGLWTCTRIRFYLSAANISFLLEINQRSGLAFPTQLILCLQQTKISLNTPTKTEKSADHTKLPKMCIRKGVPLYILSPLPPHIGLWCDTS